MAQPWPHPKTGVFWFWRAVPKDLRELVGKREELASLDTKDRAEARTRYAKKSAEVEARWANLRVGQRELTEREAHALAAPTHDRWLQAHHDEPSLQLGWHADLYPALWTAAPLPETDARPGVYGERPITNVFYASMRRLCFDEADEILAANGLIVDEWSRMKLAKAVGAALQRSSLILERAAEGEFAPYEEFSSLAENCQPLKQTSNSSPPFRASFIGIDNRSTTAVKITSLLGRGDDLTI